MIIGALTNPSIRNTTCIENRVKGKHRSIFILTIFSPCFVNESECSDDQIIRYDLKIGLDTPYPGNDVWSSMRLVSKSGEASAAAGSRPASSKQVVEGGKPVAIESPVADTAPAGPKSSGSGPRAVSPAPVSEALKATFTARAKAWAKEKKK